MSGRVRKSRPRAVKVELEASLASAINEQGPHHFSRSSSSSSSPPPNWLQIYRLVKSMRSQYIAPVDTLGGDHETDNLAPVSAATRRYQHLVALMLSSQTKDEVNAMAMKNLRLGLKDRGGLCVDSILNVSDKELDSMISKVGFHNRKTVYLKQTAAILRSKYKDDIPPTVDEMMQLPGVGPKMAYLLMQCAWNRVEGLGVDVHVHRLSNLWGWVRSKTPEQTRLALESWLPREIWAEFNPTLVGFGQTVCVPRASRCDICTLAPTGLCPGVSTARLTLKASSKTSGVKVGRGVFKSATIETECNPNSQLGYWGKLFQDEQASDHQTDSDHVKTETSISISSSSPALLLPDVEDLAKDSVQSSGNLEKDLVQPRLVRRSARQRVRLKTSGE